MKAKKTSGPEESANKEENERKKDLIKKAKKAKIVLEY